MNIPSNHLKTEITKKTPHFKKYRYPWKLILINELHDSVNYKQE